MNILLGFDGTCVRNEYPAVGKDIGAVNILKKLQDKGHKLILFTTRKNDFVFNAYDDALKWFKDNELELDFNSTAIDYIIDYRCAGIPLHHEATGYKPYVDWELMEVILKVKKIL